MDTRNHMIISLGMFAALMAIYLIGAALRGLGSLFN